MKSENGSIELRPPSWPSQAGFMKGSLMASRMEIGLIVQRGSGDGKWIDHANGSRNGEWR